MIEPVKVGIREFREKLAAFLISDRPVAVTRHGETIGLYIPTKRRRPTHEDVEAFRAAAERLDAMLEAAGVRGEDLIEEIDQKMKQKRKARQH